MWGVARYTCGCGLRRGGKDEEKARVRLVHGVWLAELYASVFLLLMYRRIPAAATQEGGCKPGRGRERTLYQPER